MLRYFSEALQSWGLGLLNGNRAKLVGPIMRSPQQDPLHQVNYVTDSSQMFHSGQRREGGSKKNELVVLHEQVHIGHIHFTSLCSLCPHKQQNQYIQVHKYEANRHV